MYTLRAFKSFLVIGTFVMTAMLFIACSARIAPAVVSEQANRIPLGTTFLTTQSVASVFSVAWSPDGKHLALGYADGSVQVRNASTGKIDFTVHGHSSQVSGHWPGRLTESTWLRLPGTILCRYGMPAQVRAC